MREIINERQALILAALESRVDARHDDLRTLTGLKDQSYFRPMTDLRERQLVDETQAGSKHVLRFSMNDKGRKALIDYEAHQRDIARGTATSAKINVMHKDYPTYQPKPMLCHRLGEFA
jgi:hypothetical protein